MTLQFEINKDAASGWWWRLWNGREVVAQSAGVYVTREECVDKIKTLLFEISANGSNVPIRDPGEIKLEV